MAVAPNAKSWWSPVDGRWSLGAPTTTEPPNGRGSNANPTRLLRGFQFSGPTEMCANYRLATSGGEVCEW